MAYISGVVSEGRKKTDEIIVLIKSATSLRLRLWTSNVRAAVGLQVGNVFQNTGDHRRRDTECDSSHNSTVGHAF